MEHSSFISETQLTPTQPTPKVLWAALALSVDLTQSVPDLIFPDTYFQGLCMFPAPIDKLVDLQHSPHLGCSLVFLNGIASVVFLNLHYSPICSFTHRQVHLFIQTVKHEEISCSVMQQGYLTQDSDQLSVMTNFGCVSRAPYHEHHSVYGLLLTVLSGVLDLLVSQPC